MQKCAAEIKKKAAPGSGQQGFVKTAGEWWSVMTPAEKQPFVEEAKRLNAEHKAMNPNYEYFSAESKTKKKARQTAKRQEKQRMVETQRRAAEKRVHDFLCPMPDASRSRTTSITPPGPAPPSPIRHQTINPAIAQMPFCDEALYSTVSGASSSGAPQRYPSQQSLDAQIYPVHHFNQQACQHPAQQQLYPHQCHQYDAQQQCAQSAAMSHDFHEYGNEAQDNNLVQPCPVDFASAVQHSGVHDGAVCQASFLESNGIPIPDLSGDFAFSESYNDSAAFPVPADDAALFGETGFVQTDMASHNDVPYYGAHTAYGSATDFSALPSFQQTHPEAHSMQLRPHTTDSAQVDISQTQPIIPLEAPVQKASIAPPTAPFISPELASIPLRHTRQLQSRLEGARGTVPRIPSPNGLSSLDLATDERPAPSRGYLRAPHEYTELDHLHDNAPSLKELNPPSHAHSVPQATASSHRRTASGTPFWPAPRDFRKHLRFCSDTPTTRPSVQRTGDWLTDWQASGLANAQSELSASGQLDAFANVLLDPLAQDALYAKAQTAPYANAQTAPYANAPTAPYAAQESGSFMDALSTLYTNAPAISWMQVPTTSYEQPPTTSYADAQTRSYVEPMMTTSSQTPAFPSAPATSHTQPSASYEQGLANSYPDAATQGYSSTPMQPYSSAQTQPYRDAPLDLYSQASELPYPDGPIPPHVDCTTPYYNPVNHQYESAHNHC
ncbi:hypothetical protein EV122DRAFT_216702 [Schizophyllum commune]